MNGIPKHLQGRLRIEKHTKRVKTVNESHYIVNMSVVNTKIVNLNVITVNDCYNINR